MGRRPNSPEDFWKQVGKSDDDDGCWPWLRSKFRDGYGQVKIRGRNRRTHQVAYELQTGTTFEARSFTPDTECVLHRCDNRACCNPRHLFLGTPGDNMRDASNKGRLTGGPGHPIPTEARARGTAHPRAKLTDADISAIRAWSAFGERTSVIAKTYGIAVHTAAKIIKRLAWAHIP